MTILSDYNQFNGQYWQSGSIRNALAYQGYKAPHTKNAYSEALLFGISGGAAFGYFHFHYEGHDPQFNILTRNTFNLFDPILERLGVIQNVIHTKNKDKARANLVEALENGEAPIVWADMTLLPYNAIPYADDNWAVMPIIVYGYENGTASIADRASVGLTVSSDELDAARARVKKEKFRIVTLEAPNPEKLAAAVSMGIWDCIKLFTEKPPRGSKNNFGFAGYQAWANALSKHTHKKSWKKLLAPGREWVAGLASAYHYGLQFGKDTSYTAERNLYANFLEEAAIILDNNALTDIASQFRTAGQAWIQLGNALLPADTPVLAELKALLDRKHEAFLTQGNAALDEIRQINTRIEEIKAQMNDDFPLSEAEIEAIQSNIADRVMIIHDIEEEAISALRDAMS